MAQVLAEARGQQVLRAHDEVHRASAALWRRPLSRPRSIPLPHPSANVRSQHSASALPTQGPSTDAKFYHARTQHAHGIPDLHGRSLPPYTPATPCPVLT
eukprot:3066306-Rhodomonas_salina.2